MVRVGQAAQGCEDERAQVIRWLRSDKGDTVRAYFQAQSDAAEEAEQAVTVPTPGGDDA